MLTLLWEETQFILEEYPLMGLAFFFLAGMLVYYQLVVVRPVILHCHPASTFDSFLRQKLPILCENYWPTFWCFESRLQTIFASFVRSTISDIRYRREVLKLFDDGEVCLDWLDDGDTSSETPIVLFLPGLTGDSQSEYIKSFVNVAHFQLNARCVVFNFRGRGGHGLKTPRTYCASNSEDLAAVVDHIKATYPRAPLMALGVSLGGILLGNYLVTHGQDVKGKIVAAMLVSICWDCFKGTESLEKQGLNRLLNRHLASCLVHSIKEVKHHFVESTLWDLESVFSSKTIKEFDDRFTCRQFGYSDYKEYYSHACLAGKLNQIRIPVLALNAEDDPFQPGDSIPIEEASQTKNVAIVTTRYGGHIGFMEGWLPTRYHFSDRLFAQYAKGVFQNTATLESIEA